MRCAFTRRSGDRCRPGALANRWHAWPEAPGGGNPSRPQAPYAELNLLARLRLKVCSEHAHGPWAKACPTGEPHGSVPGVLAVTIPYRWLHRLVARIGGFLRSGSLAWHDRRKRRTGVSV